jgi:hypothetical protein
MVIMGDISKGIDMTHDKTKQELMAMVESQGPEELIENYLNAVLYIKEVKKQKDQWISTSDRLPEATIPVLVLSRENLMVEAWLDAVDMEWVCFDDEFTLPLDKVTHWTPLLPPPPNKEVDK